MNSTGFLRCASSLFVGLISGAPDVFAKQAEYVESDHAPSHYHVLSLEKANQSLDVVRKSPMVALSAAAYNAPLHEARSTFMPKPVRPSPDRSFIEQRTPSVSEAAPLHADNLGTRERAVAFILRQMQAGHGLPKSFDAVNGNQVIAEGVNTYDSALAIWTLIEAGRSTEAKRILDIYASGIHGNMELRAFPTPDNGQDFAPLTSNAYLLFNTTRASGNWSPAWSQWNVNAGPTAWMVISASRFLQDRNDAGILAMVRKLGDGLLLLQNNPPVNDGRDHGNSQGGVRFGPPSRGSNAYDEINVENNLSAYAAFNALYKTTKDTKYRDAAVKIEKFFTEGEFYNPETRRIQKGLAGYGRGEGSTLPAHVRYSSANKRWEIETGPGGFVRPAADSMGTWAISAFGVDKVDELFGPSAAQSMWATTRANFGRGLRTNPNGTQVWTTAGRYSGPPLSGLDFSRDYRDASDSWAPDPNHVMISLEWTAGAVFAEQQILDQCARISSAYCTSHSRDLYRRDIASMKDFLATNAGAYAIGPGLNSARNGNTGFGWQAPPASVTAMASVYATFSTDPLAWARN